MLPQLCSNWSFWFVLWNYVCAGDLGDPCCPPDTCPLLSLFSALWESFWSLFSRSPIEFCTISALLFTGSYVGVNYAKSLSTFDNLPFSKLPHFWFPHIVPSSSSVMFLIHSHLFIYFSSQWLSTSLPRTVTS